MWHTIGLFSSPREVKPDSIFFGEKKGVFFKKVFSVTQEVFTLDTLFNAMMARLGLAWTIWYLLRFRSMENWQFGLRNRIVLL